jgi:fibronectin type 3 domain-containing protein
VLISSLDINPVSATRLYPLDPVQMTKAIGHATGNIIYWEAVENAKIYQVYRRAADETTWTLIKNTGSLGYKDTGAESGVKYYYKVVARNGDIRSTMDIPAVSATRP